MLWVVFAIMLFAAVALVVRPMHLHQRGTSAVAGLSIVVVVAVSAAMYTYYGTPDAPTTPAAAVASVEEMVASLDARLQENPQDPEGWKMLGRSHMELGNLPGAVTAFEKAVELENASDGETLISLGEAILSNDRSTIGGRAGELFESGLALLPNSPRGLFYGGFSAIQRNDPALAADRWEALLALSPPPEIQDVLRARIAQWRGEPAPSAAAPEAVAPQADALISVAIQLSDSARQAIQPDDSVFVIARDPRQPSPPLAVSRRTAQELPATVGISDTDAMIRGRVPSAFEELEIVVRVSGSGQPMAQSGDWFGQTLVRPTQNGAISVIVDQQVP